MHKTKKLFITFFILAIFFGGLPALEQETSESVRVLDWETCPKSNPENPKLRHTWCPTPYRIMQFEEGQEPFDPNSPDAYCKIHTEAVKYCEESGLVANPYCPSVTTEPPLPTDVCNVHKKPEPELPQLAERFRVPVIKQRYGFPIYVGAFFAKDLGINFVEITREDVKKFIHRIARNNESNELRMFAYLAYPNVCYYPHPKKPNGKYDLNVINPVWFNTLRETIRWCVDSKIMVRIVFFDEHSFDRRWDHHWTNPDNNDGFRRADGKMYDMYPDKYGHTKWANYCVRDDGRCQDECKEMYCTNMEYWFWFYDQTIKPLNEEFGDYIAFESNEINAAAFWHNDVGKRLKNEYGIPKWRMITSPRGGVDWINPKVSIRRFWIPEIHGIKYLEDYNLVDSEIVVPWIWSWDGHGGRAFVDRWDELLHITRKSLLDNWLRMQENEDWRWGGYGISGNNWLMSDDLDFANIDYKSGEVIMAELDKFLTTH